MTENRDFIENRIGYKVGNFMFSPVFEHMEPLNNSNGRLTQRFFRQAKQNFAGLALPSQEIL